jgi:hypothetical protein
MATPCKPETMQEEVKEHVRLWRKPKFRAAVEQRLKGPKAARKAMGKR